MSKLLVRYGTGEGQTTKVADRIGEVLVRRGHEATVASVADRDVDPAGYDAVLVGASVHYGKHPRAVKTFVRANRDALSRLPTAFFSVSLSSAEDDPAAEAQAAGYVDEFCESTGWHPDRIGLFGGALRYSEYGFLKRLVMRRIAGEAMPGVDASADAEFTDWHEVEAFASDVAAFLEGRLGVAPPAAEHEDSD